MAIENNLNVRIKPAIKSITDTSVPLNGEMVLVEDTNNSDNNNIKIGDNSRNVASLPNFITKTYVFIRYSNSNNPTQDTDVHTSPQSGDKYIAFYRSNTNESPSRAALSSLWSKYIGDDGTSITVKPNKASCQTVGDAYIDQDTTSSTYGHLMILTDNTTTPFTFADAGEIRGPAGNSAYVHIKYASSNTPTTSDMHPTWQSGDTYIGIYSDNNSTDSTSYTDYVWSYYIGPAGQNGQNGTTPHIDSTTGNWFIGSTDTGVHAQGAPGTSPQASVSKTGDTATITITDATSTTTAQITDGTNGTDGLSIYKSSSVTSSSTASIPINTITIPTGRTLQIRDLILTASDDIFSVTSISSPNCTVSYITNIKGANGTDGSVWFNGSSNPNNVPNAKVGDYYLNTTTFDIWKCTSITSGTQTWETVCNIIVNIGNVNLVNSNGSSPSQTKTLTVSNNITFDQEIWYLELSGGITERITILKNVSN